jgi:hypothetical protein
MKTTTFLSAVLLSLTIPTVGQIIPNSGFENWTWIGGWFENPDNWTTNNTQIITPVVKDTIPYQGNYAMQVNGTGYAQSKFAFSQHPTDIQFHVKSNIENSDTLAFDIFIHSGSNIVDTGNWINTTSITSWTLQTIAITQNSTAIDSLEIQIHGGIQTATSISVDNFDYRITGIAENQNRVDWTLFPNPIHDFGTLTFDNPKKEKHNLTIYSTTGQVARIITNITTGQVIIEKDDLPCGIYFFELSIYQQLIASGKLTVK